MKSCLLRGLPVLLCAAACADPVPPPPVVHFTNLSAEQRLAADSLAGIMKTRFLAVPDSFVNTPQGLRVTFLHAPFAPWQEPGCRATYSSAVPARPVARLIWDAMGAGTGLGRLTLVARSEPREYGFWLHSVTCGGGAAEYHFYPRDFAPAAAAGQRPPQDRA
jgi:hypothetical protein